MSVILDSVNQHLAQLAPVGWVCKIYKNDGRAEQHTVTFTRKIDREPLDNDPALAFFKTIAEDWENSPLVKRLIAHLEVKLSDMTKNFNAAQEKIKLLSRYKTYYDLEQGMRHNKVAPAKYEVQET